jgi:hypothetical protein
MYPFRFSIFHKDIAYLTFLVLSHLHTALSQLSVPLTFYTDNNCADPSTENPSFSAQLNVCIVTTGLGSVIVQTVPCSTGDVNILAYSDSACGATSTIFALTDNCFGPIHGDVAAILVTCNQENAVGVIDASPTATTTVPVGPVAGGVATSATPNAATQTTTPNAGTQTTATNGGTQTTTLVTSSSPSSTQVATPSTSAGSSGGSSGDGGFTTADIVAISVSVVGVIVAVVGVYYQRKPDSWTRKHLGR